MTVGIQSIEFFSQHPVAGAILLLLMALVVICYIFFRGDRN